MAGILAKREESVEVFLCLTLNLINHCMVILIVYSFESLADWCRQFCGQTAIKLKVVPQLFTVFRFRDNEIEVETRFIKFEALTRLFYKINQYQARFTILPALAFLALSILTFKPGHSKLKTRKITTY